MFGFVLLAVVTKHLMRELWRVRCWAVARYVLGTLCLHTQRTLICVIHPEEQSPW